MPPENLILAGSHPEDVRVQSLLGVSPHSERAAEAEHRRRQVHGGEVQGPSRKPPSPAWRAFLANHTKERVSRDFFTVSTVRFKVLFVLIILAHDWRRVVHFHIPEHPTARGTAQQVVEAFPWDTAPRLLLRDRDGVYGADFRKRVRSMGIEEVTIAARSPWQSPYVEQLIGSVRRECLYNVVVLSERHLRRILNDYFSHYHRWRCHQSLEMDCPEPRPVQPPDLGEVVEVREAGGLYRHYERLAA